MDLSVIVPIYNMAAFIQDGIKSLKNQEGVDMEVILINDGSKDDSAQVSADCIKDDNRFRLITTPNQGAGPARNTGIAAASGEYLYFFDIDDKIEPGAFKIMVSHAREASCDLLVFGYDRYKDDSKTPEVFNYADTLVDGDEARKHYDKYMQGETCIQGAPWNKLFRRDVVLSNHVEYPSLRRNQDEVFIMRYMHFVKTIRIIPNVLYHYFANTQERMWLKYKLDYDDNVEALFGFYDSIIINWNPENDGVKRLLYWMYYNCTIDAIRVLYNPKWKLKKSEIYSGLKSRVELWQKNTKRFETNPLDTRVSESRLYPFMLNGYFFVMYVHFWLKSFQRLIYHE